MKSTKCKYVVEVPVKPSATCTKIIEICCDAYHQSIREDGKVWLHFPVCTDRNCPLRHPELLAKENARLPDEHEGI